MLKHNGCNYGANFLLLCCRHSLKKIYMSFHVLCALFLPGRGLNCCLSSFTTSSACFLCTLPLLSCLTPHSYLTTRPTKKPHSPIAMNPSQKFHQQYYIRRSIIQTQIIKHGFQMMIYRWKAIHSNSALRGKVIDSQIIAPNVLCIKFFWFTDLRRILKHNCISSGQAAVHQGMNGIVEV